MAWVLLLYDVVMHILSHTMEIYNSHGSNWSPLRILRSSKLICWQYSCKNNILLHKILKSFFCIFGQINFIHWQLLLSRLILSIMVHYLKTILKLQITLSPKYLVEWCRGCSLKTWHYNIFKVTVVVPKVLSFLFGGEKTKQNKTT